MVPATGELSASCAFRTTSLYQPGKSPACFRISLTKPVSFSSTAMACEYKFQHLLPRCDYFPPPLAGEGQGGGPYTGGGGSAWPGQAAPTPIRTVCSVWPALTTSETQAGLGPRAPPAA